MNSLFNFIQSKYVVESNGRTDIKILIYIGRNGEDNGAYNEIFGSIAATINLLIIHFI